MIYWKELNSASQNNFGIVNIDLKILPGKKDWFRVFSNNQLPLSSFIDDWQTSELISEVKKYAPHLQIPVGLLAQPKFKPWQRPGVILVYYLVSLFFLLALISLVGVSFLKPVHFSILQANVGFETGVFGGMLSLLTYSKWIKSNNSEKFFTLISRTVRWNYMLPFSGWIIGFLISLVAQWIFLGWNYTGEANGLNGIVALIGFLQVGFLPYMKYARQER
jgi:hypothetical protein